MSPTTQDYFARYPDVAAAFNQNNYGMSADDFAATHYTRFGQAEGRTFGTSSSSPTGKAAVEFALANAQDPTSLQLPYGTELFAGEQGGTRYSVAGDRVIAVTPGPTGIGAQQQIYDLSGNLLEDTFIENYGKRSGMTDAIVTALAAAALGPGVVGLSAPAAAATASGLFNYSATGDLEDALKAAALAGATAYGAEGLFGGSGSEQLAADLTVADDIAQLAQIPDITPSQIADVISQNYGIDYLTASQSVANTLFPEVASTLSDVGAALPSAIPDSVTIASQPLAPIPAASTAGATLGAITGQTGTTTERVPVEEQRGTPPVVPSGTIINSLFNPVPTAPEQVPVEDTRIREPEVPIGTIIPSLLSPTLTPPVPTSPTPPPVAPEQVTVEGTRDRPPVFDPIFPITPTIFPPGVPPMAPPTPPAPPPTGPDLKGLLTPNNLLGLLSLLGATGAVTGTTTPPPVGVPPSDTNIGSTTPQFGPDYYAAVQRYYNAYMPETPRNVAGPLQQWYENKYGA